VLLTDDVRYNNAFLDFANETSGMPIILGGEFGILVKI